MSLLHFLINWINDLFSVQKTVPQMVQESAKYPMHNDPEWLKIARGEIGIKEIAGVGKHNKRILEYHHSTGETWVLDDETAWCSSFANWCIEEAGLEGTDKLNARSWLNWGQKIDIPRRGCVAIFWRDKKNSWMGHVGFYLRDDGKYIYLLGGNQKNEVNVTKYPMSRLLGYRWPQGIEKPL